jgi:hypothetical protein
MHLSRLSMMSCLLASALVACGDDGGKGGGGNPDAAMNPMIDAPMADAPSTAITGLGQKCEPQMMGQDCPTNAPVCAGFTGTPTYCTPQCVTNGTATGAANGQFTNIQPAPSNAACTAAYTQTIGMPQCVGILNNYMPADATPVMGKAYTNINMTCAVLCSNNACPPGMSTNNSLGTCVCFPN